MTPPVEPVILALAITLGLVWTLVFWRDEILSRVRQAA